MAVVKEFRSDLSGELIARDDVIVVRVGTTADRPDACDRLDISPADQHHTIGQLLTVWQRIRSLNENGEVPSGDAA